MSAEPDTLLEPADPAPAEPPAPTATAPPPAAAELPVPADTGGGPVIGYVLKMYPRFSETFIVSEILAREAQGERIVIFSLRPCTDARFHPELARVQAPVVHISRPTSAARLWDTLGRSGSDPGLLTGLTRALPELLEHGYDDAVQATEVAQLALELGVRHLHAHFASVATTVARLAACITGLPYSFTAHAKDIFHEDVDEADLRRKFADAHHAITISDFNVADLRRRFPEATGRLKLVRNGLHLDRFPFEPRTGAAGTSAPAGSPAGTSAPAHDADAVPLRLLSVGRLVEKKGFGLLIEAVHSLRARGLDVTAEIAGDGPLAPELRRQVEDLELGDAVRLLGPITQSQVSELLGSRDVFVAPFVVGSDGNADGLPTVLLEAMARGMRCVAADVTAVGEVVVTGQTGWLVPTGNVDALAAAIEEAARPDAGHARLVASARALVEEQFDSRRQAARLRELTAA